MKFESTRQKGIVSVLAIAVLLAAFTPFVADTTNADGSGTDYDDNSFYRYTIKFFSTSQDAEYLIWDFADGTVLDGRWEYYAQKQNNGEDLTEEQATGLAAYRALLVENGNSIYAPTHTYATVGNYDYTITAINPIGYVGEGGMPYDGAFSTDETGFDGGLMAGITLDTYDDTDRSVSGAWDTATVALGVRGYPTISFVSNGGTTVSPIIVENNDTYVAATEPVAPTKDDCEFAGWYADEELSTAYDWTQPVTAPMTLYAKWNANEIPEPEKITVTIDGESSLFEPGSTVADLTVPTKEGYTFAGWYSDADCTQALAVDTVMTDGMQIFSKWTQNAPVEKITVTIDGKDVEIDKGMTVADLTEPTKEGYTFAGWYSDADCTQALAGDFVLTDGMNAYAKWNASGIVPGDSDGSSIDWIPIVAMIVGAIVCLVGLRFHPVILVAGLVIAVVGGLDFGGIINLF